MLKISRIFCYNFSLRANLKMILPLRIAVKLKSGNSYTCAIKYLVTKRMRFYAGILVQCSNLKPTTLKKIEKHALRWIVSQNYVLVNELIEFFIFRVGLSQDLVYKNVQLHYTSIHTIFIWLYLLNGRTALRNYCFLEKIVLLFSVSRENCIEFSNPS